MSSKQQSPRDLILETLQAKSSLKLKVYKNTLELFDQLKGVLEEVAKDLSSQMQGIDEEVKVEFRDKGPYEADLRFGGDVLIFNMHSNVFAFDADHSIWKTSYVKEDESRMYCGMINIYNFLKDSFKYQRMGDMGYLIGRLFVNRESHYFVEGKRQLAFLYNDFVNAVLDKEHMRNIIQSAILYALDFDLLTPPYDDVKVLTLQEMQEAINNLNMRTGKRLGFKFQADGDDFV
ncbi:MAG: hypothetical protein H6585_02485 [Flavobacteriales bacterium]|nr:hypothetical protein [Flavobacteriales bacterium]MCB9447196.1 hypothetical protein [Flavobacteriales bacterium]